MMVRCSGFRALVLVLALAIRTSHGLRRLDRPFPHRMLAETEPALGEIIEDGERILVEEDATSADQHKVTSLPGLSDPLEHWAGMLSVDEEKSGKLFYWFFKADEAPEEKPLVVWLNGGPGCSSMDGLFLEHGPFKVDENLKLNMNPHSWHKVANMLYIDQPVGTGWSYTATRNYCRNDVCIASNMHHFLTRFFRLHDWLLASKTKTRPLFFTGESQAGHYIPAICSYIVDRNDEIQGGDVEASGKLVLDLQGMAIGNGWFDPATQYDVSDFAHGVGLISQGQLETQRIKREQCQAQLGKNNKWFLPLCFSLLDDVTMSTGSDATGQVSLYDYRIFDDPVHRQFPFGYRTVEKYLNQASVKKALHAGASPLDYQECTDPPYDALKHQDGLGVTAEITKLLERQVRSLFFNGVFDVICNHVGNEEALMKLQWSGANEFKTSPRYTWLVKGIKPPGGYAKVSGPLTYLIVLDTGHMVPLGAPVAALDMLRRFLENRGFVDRAQSLEMSLPVVDPRHAPPATPKLKAVTQVDDTTVSLTFEPAPHAPTSAGASADDALWYTVLANPGGQIMVPSTVEETPHTLLLHNLKQGVKHTFRLIANTNAGASAPSSEELSVVLGCAAPSDTCSHGVCGYDEQSKAKRCFCYRGYTGASCSEEGDDQHCADAGQKGVATKGVNGAGGGGGGAGGRVLYSVSKDCEPPSTMPCVLRFTVPFKMASGMPAAPSPADPSPAQAPSDVPSAEFAYLDGPEEIRAFEKLLRRDLAHVLGAKREDIVLRSLHPNTTTPLSADATATAPTPRVTEAVDTFLCTFDVLSPVRGVDPAAKVETFRALWEGPSSWEVLRYGVVSSNFDNSGNVAIGLVSMDTPLAVGEDVRDLPLRKSIVVTVVTILSFLVCLAILARVSRTFYRSGGAGSPPSFRKARQNRRVDTSEPVGSDVEVMEIRTATPSGHLTNPSGVAGAARGMVAGLRIGSREGTDDGARERLV